MFLLPTKSPHPREAAIFLTYMGSAPAVFQWVYQGGDLPPVKAVALGQNEYGKLWQKRHVRDAPYGERHREGMRAHIFDDPSDRLDQSRLAEVDGHVASYVRVNARTLTYGPATLPMAGIASVSTLPAYRGRGLATAVLADCLAY